MIGADTNIVVRYLTADIADQAQKVRAFLLSGGRLYINEAVLTELYWVLTNVYDYPKNKFIKAIDQLMNTEGFEFFDVSVLQAAIADYIDSSAGFNDCLIQQINKHNGHKTLTFDKKASKLKEMKLLA
ncbi:MULTISPECIES: PIN domain-containing protein [Gracilimonas]|uniref:Type II toxin-antitoxin system VapC family toxin n=1 Tax=Gracilimonas sediminicola TaxID=2952158 RepID=A0A9X2L352_9BACT|nr:type II toxin-antitoxin system VapC family toxin [Gracilimonas sediminicola]MCP9291063.1 type II toxin-antitoxin system VapC family toxin [Gracilimonas sediminicola]